MARLVVASFIASSTRRTSRISCPATAKSFQSASPRWPNWGRPLTRPNGGTRPCFRAASPTMVVDATPPLAPISQMPIAGLAMDCRILPAYALSYLEANRKDHKIVRRAPGHVKRLVWSTDSPFSARSLSHAGNHLEDRSGP